MWPFKPKDPFKDEKAQREYNAPRRPEVPAIDRFTDGGGIIADVVTKQEPGTLTYRGNARGLITEGLADAINEDAELNDNGNGNPVTAGMLSGSLAPWTILDKPIPSDGGTWRWDNKRMEWV